MSNVVSIGKARQEKKEMRKVRIDLILTAIEYSAYVSKDSELAHRLLVETASANTNELYIPLSEDLIAKVIDIIKDPMEVIAAKKEVAKYLSVQVK